MFEKHSYVVISEYGLLNIFAPNFYSLSPTQSYGIDLFDSVIPQKFWINKLLYISILQTTTTTTTTTTTCIHMKALQ